MAEKITDTEVRQRAANLCELCILFGMPGEAAFLIRAGASTSQALEYLRAKTVAYPLADACKKVLAGE